jgi:hypothetical protein
VLELFYSPLNCDLMIDEGRIFQVTKTQSFTDCTYCTYFGNDYYGEQYVLLRSLKCYISRIIYGSICPVENV